jgi:hypothetical protein
MRFTLVCTLVGLLLVLVAGGGQGRASDGPLTSKGFGIAGAKRKVGQVIETSFVVANRSRTPATIERIQLRSDPALRLVGIRTLPLAQARKGRGIPGIVDGFPSPDLRYKGVRTARGTLIPHGSTLFLVGLTATRPGVHTTQQVVVDYRVGVQRFRGVYWFQVYLCTPGTCRF